MGIAEILAAKKAAAAAKEQQNVQHTQPTQVENATELKVPANLAALGIVQAQGVDSKAQQTSSAVQTLPTAGKAMVVSTGKQELLASNAGTQQQAGKKETFAEMVARKKREAESAKSTIVVFQPTKSGILAAEEKATPKIVRPDNIDLTPAQQQVLQTLEDSGEAQAYSDIAIRINSLQYNEVGESLQLAMDELKASLKKNAAACLLLQDPDIAQMVIHWRKLVNVEMAASPTEKKEKKKKPAKELTELDIKKQLELPDDF